MKHLLFLLLTLVLFSCVENRHQHHQHGNQDAAAKELDRQNHKFHEHEKLNYTAINSISQYKDSEIYEYDIDDKKYYSIGKIDLLQSVPQAQSKSSFALYKFSTTIPKGIFNLKDTLNGNFIGKGFTNDCPGDRVCTTSHGNRSCYNFNGKIHQLISYQLDGSLMRDSLVPILMNLHDKSNSLEFWKMSKHEYENISMLSEQVPLGVGSNKEPMLIKYANIGFLKVHNINDLFIVINPNKK